MKKALKEFYYGPGNKFDVRKFWQTLTWIAFFLLLFLKIGLIIYDFIGIVTGKEITNANELIPEWLLGIIAGKASLIGYAYNQNKKIVNGNNQTEHE